MPLFKPTSPKLPRYDLPDVAGLIEQVYGTLDPDKLTVFVPAKNEMALIPAFLAHHRELGFEQFLWFDDGSDDGTFEYLRTQPDCVVVHMKLRFGEVLQYTGPSHKKTDKIRFGTYVKMALPQHFFPGKLVAYLDVDEFLLLPPGVQHMREVVDRIDALGSTGAIASVVEFFPASTKAFDAPLPQSFEGLINAYGWFEAEALFDPSAPRDDKGKPVFTAPSKSMRLFDDYGIETQLVRDSLRKKLYLSSREIRDQQFNRSARHKTPLLYRTDESFMFSGHDAIIPPNGEILLTIAHFIFTSNFARKIEAARAWKTHAKGGVKYAKYSQLLEALDGVEDGFLTERSQRFESAQQLIDCGLMKW